MERLAWQAARRRQIDSSDSTKGPNPKQRPLAGSLQNTKEQAIFVCVHLTTERPRWGVQGLFLPGQAKVPLSWQELGARQEKPGVRVAPTRIEHSSDQAKVDSSAAYFMSH